MVGDGVGKLGERDGPIMLGKRPTPATSVLYRVPASTAVELHWTFRLGAALKGIPTHVKRHREGYFPELKTRGDRDV